MNAETKRYLMKRLNDILQDKLNEINDAYSPINKSMQEMYREEKVNINVGRIIEKFLRGTTTIYISECLEGYSEENARISQENTKLAELRNKKQRALRRLIQAKQDELLFDGDANIHEILETLANIDIKTIGE